MKDIEFKRVAVKNHYEIAYGVQFKRSLTVDEINHLYNKLQQLRFDETLHYERRPALRLLVDNTCQRQKTIVNSEHDGNKAS